LRFKGIKQDEAWKPVMRAFRKFVARDFKSYDKDAILDKIKPEETVPLFTYYLTKVLKMDPNAPCGK